jgi:hypothetical protein
MTEIKNAAKQVKKRKRNKAISPTELSTQILEKHTAIAQITFTINMMYLANATNLNWMIQTVYYNIIARHNIFEEEFINRCILVRKGEMPIIEFFECQKGYLAQLQGEYKRLVRCLKAEISRSEMNIGYYAGKSEFMEKEKEQKARLETLKEVQEMVKKLEQNTQQHLP